MIAGIVLGFVIGCLASAPYYYGEMKKLRDKHSEEARLWHSRKAGLLVQIANLKSELSEANAKLNPPKHARRVPPIIDKVTTTCLLCGKKLSKQQISQNCISCCPSHGKLYINGWTRERLNELTKLKEKISPPKCQRCKRFLSKKITRISSDGEMLCPECFRKHLDAGGK